MKHVDLKSRTCIDFDEGNNKEDSGFEVGEYWNIKTPLLKVTLQIGLRIKKV